MLQPRKNPLIDGPLFVGATKRLRLLQVACVLSFILLLAFLLSLRQPESAVGADAEEVWWHRLVSRIALQRLAKDVDTSVVSEMKQQVARLEAERVSLGDRLAEAERLLSIDRSQQRLSHVVAHREGQQIVFEILLRTPPGSSNAPPLTIDVMAARKPEIAPSVSQNVPFVLNLERSTRLTVPSPKVAETLQGRLTSSGSHLLVMLLSGGDTSRAEAALVPVNGNN